MKRIFHIFYNSTKVEHIVRLWLVADIKYSTKTECET
jgi:hypothetical protein